MRNSQIFRTLLLTIPCLLLANSAKAQWNPDDNDNSTTALIYRTGHVGIGITVPIAPLHVVGTTILDGNVGVGTDAPSTNLVIKDILDDVRLRFEYDVSGTSTSSEILVNGSGMNFKNYNGSRNFLFTGGNVGVGTASPFQRLEVANGGLQVTGNITAPTSPTSAYLVDYIGGVSRYWSRGIDGETRGEFIWNILENDGGNQLAAMTIKSSGNVGIGIGTTTGHGNLQIGHSTQNGMVFLGGGKGASGIGSTRSDGGLILGKNIYSRYDDVSDNKVGRVALGSDYGFSGIKLTHNGEIDFFGAKGRVEADDIANSNQNIKMKIDTDGNVGIGTTDPGSYKLAVEGKIGARSFKVTTAPWADYVFAPSYQLMPLTEVENYIQQNQHLPNVPSAKEVEENGFELEEMDAKLMEKIEELTLYMIAQEKSNRNLEQRVKQLEEENSLLKTTNGHH